MAYISVGDSIKTQVDQIVISYDVVGDGYPIILLHGWGANRLTFKRLSLNLSDRFKVYSIDLPGFGDTQIGLPYNVYEVADIIFKFCQNLNIEKPIILGHSYGGRIAMIYASKYECLKLVLVSAAGIRQRINWKKRFSIRVYKILKKCKINVKMGSRDYIDADNVKRRMLIDAIHTDLKPEMKRINVETLLIYGQNDKVTPLDLAKDIKANIKNSSLITIEECGHFPYLERPSVFQLVLDSFLVVDL